MALLFLLFLLLFLLSSFFFPLLSFFLWVLLFVSLGFFLFQEVLVGQEHCSVSQEVLHAHVGELRAQLFQNCVLLLHDLAVDGVVQPELVAFVASCVVLPVEAVNAEGGLRIPYRVSVETVGMKVACVVVDDQLRGLMVTRKNNIVLQLNKKSGLGC